MGLPVVVAVLNNSILGYEKHAEKVLFDEYTDACDFTPVDHAAIARGAGCAGIRIENAGTSCRRSRRRLPRRARRCST